MTTPPSPAGKPAGQAPPPDPVLPVTTRDETDLGWGGASWRDDPDDDERFLRDRPPHWQ